MDTNGFVLGPAASAGIVMAISSQHECDNNSTTLSTTSQPQEYKPPVQTVPATSSPHKENQATNSSTVTASLNANQVSARTSNSIRQVYGYITVFLRGKHGTNSTHKAAASSDTKLEGDKCLYLWCHERALLRGLCYEHGGGEQCKHVGCCQQAMGNGFCVRHGGVGQYLEVREERQVNGDTQNTQDKDVMQWRTLCSHTTCMHPALKEGKCSIHLLGGICTYLACSKPAQTPGGRCINHEREQCLFVGCARPVESMGACHFHGVVWFENLGCGTMATAKGTCGEYGQSDLRSRPGDIGERQSGKRCLYQGCEGPVGSTGTCLVHCSANWCSSPGCTGFANKTGGECSYHQGKSGYGDRAFTRGKGRTHIRRTKCSRPGCTDPAWTKELCVSHSVDSHDSPQNRFKPAQRAIAKDVGECVEDDLSAPQEDSNGQGVKHSRCMSPARSTGKSDLHSGKDRCSTSGCTGRAYKGGEYIYHSDFGPCLHPGCTSGAISGGKCFLHGRVVIGTHSGSVNAVWAGSLFVTHDQNNRGPVRNRPEPSKRKRNLQNHGTKISVVVKRITTETSSQVEEPRTIPDEISGDYTVSSSVTIRSVIERRYAAMGKICCSHPGCLKATFKEGKCGRHRKHIRIIL